MLNHLLYANLPISTVFTRYPLVTLGGCGIVVIGLSIGMTSMKIVSDPVELWAASHSRARSEKDYFDNAFKPFYRTAQIFIKPVTSKNVIGLHS